MVPLNTVIPSEARNLFRFRKADSSRETAALRNDNTDKPAKQSKFIATTSL